MNEQIKELAKQCWEERLDGQHFDSEQFAELIVRECLGDFKERITRRYQGSDYDRAVAYGMEIVYLDIVDKFGVE